MKYFPPKVKITEWLDKHKLSALPPMKKVKVPAGSGEDGGDDGGMYFPKNAGTRIICSDPRAY
jgi:hypothetical protein